MEEMASVGVPGSARVDLGLGEIRRCAQPCGPELSIEGLRTIYEVFEASVLAHGSSACLGHRPIGEDGEAHPFEWITYAEVMERALNFGSGLTQLGLCEEAGADEEQGGAAFRGLGFFGKNRPEWVIGEMGCYSKSVVPVPMYDTLGAESVEYVVRQTEIQTVFCTSQELTRVCAVAVSAPGILASVILMDADDLKPGALPALREEAGASGLTLFTLEEVEEAGRLFPSPKKLPSGTDVAFFCYTSGTTGDPKGALISHQGILSCLSGLLKTGLQMYPEDVHLSYLPLPHVFERGILYSVLYGGGRIGFFQGDALKILEDIQALRPTVFPSVPRLLNRVYDKILAGVREAGGAKQWLFERALRSKVAGLRQGRLTHAVWDRLVFNAVKEKIGFGRVRLLMTGSAPIRGEVLDFLRAIMGCPVCEGYGQTESSLLCTFTALEDCSTGHVGVPAPCNEIRLVAVGEMGYLPVDTQHTDGTACLGRGEICYRGSNVFKGYFKMADKTAETIDADGWVHTGDIGLWTADGKLRIIDRKKNIFKLAQGEYVAAEKIENILAASPLVLQSFVYGDSLKNCLVAIVVPDPEALAAQSLKFGDAATKKAVMDEVAARAYAADLKGFEVPKAIFLCASEFNALPARTFENAITGASQTIDNVLTPTFKLVRNKAKDYFLAEIDSMYADMAATASKL